MPEGSTRRNDWCDSGRGAQRLAICCCFAGCGSDEFYCYSFIDRLSGSVLIFDAAGLALFAVTGATKALAYHLDPVAAALLGMLTGIGGGMMRDILTAEVPVVLRADFYAIAALTADSGACE